MGDRKKRPLIGTAWWLMVAVCSGCASAPLGPVTTLPSTLPALQGSYHTVRPRETLWRIARSYGLDAQTLADANHLHSPADLRAGAQLFIPLPPESTRFLWPTRGTLKTSSTSWVEISAPAGSLVRASRSGRVAAATRQLSGWGKTVVLDHLDGYLTIYAGLEQILVAPGAALRQGMPIGSVGPNALHFEIRHGVHPKSVLALLPSE